MKYTIDDKTITFSTVTWVNRDHLALDVAAFNEAPHAEKVIIKNRRGHRIWADANKVLVHAVPVLPKKKMYQVPLDIFREVMHD